MSDPTITNTVSSRVDGNGVVTVTPASTVVAQAVDQQQQSTVVEKAAKPEHVPDKFWNAETGVVNYEEWAKSTRELEQRFHSQNQNKQEPPADKPDASKQGEQPPVVAPATLDGAMQKATQELSTAGALSEETFKAFEALGVSRVAVQTHADGVIAIQNAIQAEVHSVTGNADGWNAANEWAQANLSAEEQAALNVRLGNRATMKPALQELWGKYQQSMGTEGKKVSGTSPNASGSIEPYANKADMLAAVRDPKYKTDAAFRATHGRRILASQKAGIKVF